MSSRRSQALLPEIKIIRSLWLLPSSMRCLSTHLPTGFGPFMLSVLSSPSCLAFSYVFFLHRGASAQPLVPLQVLNRNQAAG